VPPQAFGVRPFEGVLGIGQGVVLSLRIDEPVWEAAPTLIRDQVAGLQQEARRREIYQYYGQQFQPRQGRPGAEGAAAEPADGAPAAQADTPASGALASRLLSADELMRATVIDAKNRNVGRIDDMIVDLVDGQLAFVVIRPDTGLFERADAEYAVAPKAIAYSAPDRIVLNLTESQLQGAQVLTEATLKQRAIELAGKDVAELRKSPPVYRFETRGKTGR
jgi:sporulation protein YlmC with PRC-barrel domain